MKKRSRVDPKKDQRMFTRTASKVKAINLPLKIFRGGIRF